MAERFREQLFNAGMIPQSQWTEEEQQKVADQQAQAANQPPAEDPNMLIAQAEMGKAQAENTNAQTKQEEAQFNAQVKSAQVALEQDKVALDREKLQFDVQKFVKGQDDKFNVDAAKIQQGQQKLDMETSRQEQIAFMDQMKLEQQKLNDSFTNLKTMREAMGIESIVGPGNTKAYIDQAQIVQDEQTDAE